MSKTNQKGEVGETADRCTGEGGVQSVVGCFNRTLTHARLPIKLTWNQRAELAD